jgi:hypothetical protein
MKTRHVVTGKPPQPPLAPLARLPIAVVGEIYSCVIRGTGTIWLCGKWHQVEGAYGACHAGPLSKGNGVLAYEERNPSTAVSDFTVTACYFEGAVGHTTIKTVDPCGVTDTEF